jgi:hypothetical protein
LSDEEQTSPEDTKALGARFDAFKREGIAGEGISGDNSSDPAMTALGGSPHRTQDRLEKLARVRQKRREKLKAPMCFGFRPISNHKRRSA